MKEQWKQKIEITGGFGRFEHDAALGTTVSIVEAGHKSTR